jgi:hypothetical protein
MKVFNSKGEFEYKDNSTGERTVCPPSPSLCDEQKDLQDSEN